MASFNKVVLMGNITRNPDVRSIPGSGTAVARTGIAVNRKHRDKEEVMFIDIVAFGRNAEIMGEYITKGSPLLIEGRLSMSSWEQDGVRRTKHEVIVDTFQMMSNRRDSQDGYSNYNTNYDEYKSSSSRKDDSYDYGNQNIDIKKDGNIIDDDDIPF